MKRIYTILYLLLVLHSAVFAQVTITQSDAMGLINTYITKFYYQLDGSNLDLGTASSTAQTWNFTNINNMVVNGDTSVDFFSDPSGLPGQSHFPNANLAVKQEEFLAGITTTFVTYLNIGSSAVSGLGMYTRISFPPFLDSSYVSRYSPPSVFFPLPLTYGTASTTVDTFYIEGATEVSERSLTANGFGTLIFPNGTSVQAIRYISDTKTISNEGGFSNYYRQTRVSFLAKDFSEVEVDVDSNYNGGSYSASDFSYSLPGNMSSVEQQNTVPTGYELHQNYPNPFNPNTIISFSILEGNHVSLNVYDVLGNEVAQLVNEQLGAGTYNYKFDASNLTSGIYFYKLKTNNHTFTKKMMLLK